MRIRRTRAPEEPPQVAPIQVAYFQVAAFNNALVAAIAIAPIIIEIIQTFPRHLRIAKTRGVGITGTPTGRSPPLLYGERHSSILLVYA